MNAEEVKVGCFQVVIVLLLSVNYVIVSMSHALPLFHNYTPEFYCYSKNATNKTYGCQLSSNSTIQGLLNSTFGAPLEFGTCPGEYRFETESGMNSVVTEWSLVCEKRFLMFLGSRLYYTGELIGAWIAGVVADRIGRLPIQAICLYTQGTMAVALYIVQHYPAFLALRSLQGVFVQGLQNSTYILSLELFPARARTLVTFVMQSAWTAGLILLAVLSYAIPDWRILQLAISVPTALTVLYVWIIPEPPRWLLAKGKSTEADMALERIAKYNGCCSTTHQENSVNCYNVNIKEDIPPKIGRKSRSLNIDFRKAESDKIIKDEAVSLLAPSGLAQQKKLQEINLEVIAQDVGKKHFDDELQKQNVTSTKLELKIEKREKRSSLKHNRQLRSISQPVYNQEIALRNEEDIVELRSIVHKSKERNGANRRQSQEKYKPNVNSNNRKKDDLHIIELLRRPIPRKYCFVLMSQWLTSSMACHIIEAHTPNFNMNGHINFTLGSLLEVVSYMLMYLVLSRYGRRLPMSIYQLCNSIICIVIAGLVILPSNTMVWMDLTKTVVLLLGKIAIVTTVSIVYLYSVEIFPTVIRGTCLGLCVVFGKLGSLSTPHILSLGKQVSYAAPLIVGILCLMAAILALMLPETLNKTLPDTIEDMERLERCNEKDVTECVSTDNGDVVAKDVLQHKKILEKLFSEDWVDAGNGILVNFTENTSVD